MEEGRLLNLSNRNLKQLDFSSISNVNSPLYSLTLDDNQLEEIQSLEQNKTKDKLVQLSVMRNCLSGPHTFLHLKNVRVMSLCGNKITALKGFKNLPSLEFLSVSGNELTNVDGLSTCDQLVHLDLSDNRIEKIPMLRSLNLLHTFLLHGNQITSLANIPKDLPNNLVILSLAENNIHEFTQVKHVSSLGNLEQLSIMRNPCIEKVTQTSSDSYRPLVVSWCHKLNILDGFPITEREKMAADWLLNSTTRNNQSKTNIPVKLQGKKEIDDNENGNADNVDEMKYSKHSPSTELNNRQQTEKSANPLRYRVSDKEKRKRVHAWLGAQVNPEDKKASNSSLLESKSEFIQGNQIPSPTKNTDEKMFANRKDAIEFELESKNYREKIASALASTGNMYQAEHTDINDNAKYIAALQSGKLRDYSTYTDDYCYVFDSTVARTYAKKYGNLPGKFNEFSDLYRNHSLLGDPPVTTDRSPAATNNTKHFSQKTRIKPFTINSNEITDCDTVEPISKYAEYDRRPIKPLSNDLQQSMYGVSSVDKDRYKPKIRRTQSAASHNKKTKLAPRSTSAAAIHGDEEPSSIDQTIKKHQTNLNAEKKYPTKSEPPSKSKSNKSEPAFTVTELPALPVDIKHVQAATRIQALWRGYRTRKYNIRVVEVRQEVRSRRAEQYISFLCHEVQLLKDRLVTEHKMRDLQTEAIRYIWAHVRPVIKQAQAGGNDKSSRKKSPDGKRQRSARSPRRRSQGRNGSQMTSPRVTPRKPASETKSVTTEDFGDETESSVTTVPPAKTRKPDASWKDEIIEAKPALVAAEDTDEGRGTIVTDGEGNPVSSAEEASPKYRNQTAPNRKFDDETLHLRNMVATLQSQVLDLQEAMLAMTSQLRASPDVVNHVDKEIRARLPSPTATVKLREIATPVKKISSMQTVNVKPSMQKMSLHNILLYLNSPLNESELWALCEQMVTGIRKQQQVTRCISLETVFIRKDGRIDFTPDAEVDKLVFDEMYLAPEVLDGDKPSCKSAIFSTSVTLWSAADWNMAEDKSPDLSAEFGALLEAMSHDNVGDRAQIGDVIKICEDYHAQKCTNSLAICASFFTDAVNARSVQTGFNRNELVREITEDKIVTTKQLFRSKVVPEINSFGLRPTLKPACERILSPRPLVPPSPREKLLTEIQFRPALREVSPPKLFTVREMFESDPELIRKVNILPGQKRKNMKAMKILMARQTPCDPTSGPRPGVPTPPRALRAEVKEEGFDVEKAGQGLCSVVMRWHASKVFDKQAKEVYDKILGYRIYVNGQPKGMVAGTKTRALLEGLRKLTEYRVHVRAVSDIGESEQSNTVVAHITTMDSTNTKATHSPVPTKRSPDKSNPHQSVVSTEQNSVPPKPQPRNRTHSPEHSNTALKSSKLENFACTFQPQPARSKVINEEEITISKVVKDERKPTTTDDTLYNQNSNKENVASCDSDVIDRVLRRYGINQSAAVVPAYASGSSLPPLSVKFNDRLSTSKSEPGANMESVSMATDDINNLSRSTFQELSGEIMNDTTNDTTIKQSDITPRSQALLAQLKDNLLN